MSDEKPPKTAILPKVCGAPVLTPFPDQGQLWYERIDHSTLYHAKFYLDQCTVHSRPQNRNSDGKLCACIILSQSADM